MLPADPVIQELERRAVTQRGMLPLSVVKHLDVLKAGSLHIGVGSVTHAMHPLVLGTVEPAFHQRVDASMSRSIPAVPFAAHRADHAVFLELVLKGMAGVLATPVGMVDQTRCRPLAEPMVSASSRCSPSCVA